MKNNLDSVRKGVVLLQSLILLRIQGKNWTGTA